jgi:hypothetical protein
MTQAPLRTVRNTTTRDMRGYGPKEYPLGIDTNERRNNKLEYGQATTTQGTRCSLVLEGPSEGTTSHQQWHGGTRRRSQTTGWPTNMGVRVEVGMFACGVEQATTEHVYIRCTMHNKNRPGLLVATTAWQDMVERAGMRRPRVEEALVWVHWHDEGLNMMINMAKGGPAGMVGVHHMASTHKTVEEMRCGRRTRSGKQRRPTWRYATGDGPERRRAAAGRMGWGAWWQSLCQRQWDEGQWRQLNLLQCTGRERARPRPGACRCPSPTTRADLGFCWTPPKKKLEIFTNNFAIVLQISAHVQFEHHCQ